MPQIDVPPSPTTEKRLKLTEDLRETLTPDQAKKMARIKEGATKKQAAVIRSVAARYPSGGPVQPRRKAMMDALVAGNIRILEEGERESRAFLNARQRTLLRQITALSVQELRDVHRDWLKRWKAAQKSP